MNKLKVFNFASNQKPFLIIINTVIRRKVLCARVVNVEKDVSSKRKGLQKNLESECRFSFFSQCALQINITIDPTYIFLLFAAFQMAYLVIFLPFAAQQMAM